MNNTQHTQLGADSLDWQSLILKLCALRDEMRLMDDYDSGHPVFMALDRCVPGMSKEDGQFCDNVIGHYREVVDLRALMPARVRRSLGDAMARTGRRG